MNITPLVNIVMVTYNHEKYIAKAIESVLMQKTTFHFQLIIGEDCSIDSTRIICRKYSTNYPKKVILIENKQNLGLVKNYKNVINNCTAKYLAVLEGDDFWNHENKLQKQVEILENNPSIGLVHANFNLLTNGKITRFSPPKHVRLEGRIYNDLIKGNFIGSLTVCLRKSILDEHLDFRFMIENNFRTIDYAMWLEMGYHSNFAYINEELATYRMQMGSLSIQKSFKEKEVFMETIFKTLEYFKNKYSTNESLIESAYDAINYYLLLEAIHYNDLERANYYASICKPIGLIQKIRCFAAKEKTLILIGKRISLFN